MAEPGLLECGPGSRVRLGSVLLTTARHTLGLSILRLDQEGLEDGTACAHRLALSLPVTNMGCHNA